MQVLKTRLTSLANTLSPWLLLVCVTVFCWFLASTAWLFIAPPKAVNFPVVNLGSNTKKASFNPDIFSVFKVYVPVQRKEVVNKPAPRPTSLMLQGIMRAIPKSQSKVIISYQNTIKSYHINDKIADTEFVLSDILERKAIIADTQGNTLTVDLYKEFQLNSSLDINANNASSTPYLRPTQTKIKPYVNDDQQTVPPPAHASNKKVTKKKKVFFFNKKINNMLENAAEELENNPANYLNKMGVVAGDDGYTITGQMNSTMRRNIGLEPGDKIISVNGQSLGQAQQDAALLKEIQRTRSAAIQVKRGSQVITIRQQF